MHARRPICTYHARGTYCPQPCPVCHRRMASRASEITRLHTTATSRLMRQARTTR